MRALGLLGSLAIGCLVTLGTSCGSDDDNKGDGGGTGGGGGSAATGGTGGSAATGGTGGSAATGGTGGSTGGGATSFACDYNIQGGVHYCWTWDAGNIPMPATVISAWQMACTQGMGMTVTSCPTSGAVGKCTFTSSNGGYNVAQTVYYYPPVTAATGMQLCMANNASGVTATWSAP
jgi:hypothetical protein